MGNHLAERLPNPLGIWQKVKLVDNQFLEHLLIRSNLFLLCRVETFSFESLWRSLIAHNFKELLLVLLNEKMPDQL